MKDKKSFKDYVPEETLELDVIVQPLHEEVIVNETVVIDNHANDANDVAFDYQLLEEQIRDDVTFVIAEEYEQKFNELKMSLHEEVMENTVRHLQENHRMVMTMTEAVMDMAAKLYEKIDLLQTNLNITVPTPIVQVTLPERNTIKKVHRDNNGNITHVSEEACENGQDNFNIGDKE